MRQQQRDNQMTMTWNKQWKEDTCHVELLWKRIPFEHHKINEGKMETADGTLRNLECDAVLRVVFCFELCG